MGHTIIAGLAGHKAHSTYHESGERHTKIEDSVPGKYHAVREVERPAELRGIEHMHILSFNNEAAWFGEKSPLCRSRPGSRADAIVTLDSRAMQANAAYQLRLGVAGVEGRAALEAQAARIAGDGGWAIEREEVFGVRTPLVWLTVVRSLLAERQPGTARLGFAGAVDYNHLADGCSVTLLSAEGAFAPTADGSRAVPFEVFQLLIL
jgi:hypothetical protein